MIEIFLMPVILFLTFYYIRARKNDYYFNYKLIDENLNFVELNYIYYDSYKTIRKDTMVIPYTDVDEIIEILEDCFNKNISIK